MHGIRTSAVFKPVMNEEERKEFKKRKHARKWVEFPRTDCHSGWHSVCQRIDNWRNSISLEDLQKFTLKLGSTCFRCGNGHDHPAAITDPSFEIGPEHMSVHHGVTTWWYKPVWDD